MPVRMARAGESEIAAVAALANKLWPAYETASLEHEFFELISSEKGALFLALEGDKAVGFAQISLRSDYVEGTNGATVGYLEGIYVEPGCRRRGIARRLLDKARRYAKQRGCWQFASDCALDNEESIAFHMGCGFWEANRIVCFVCGL